MSAAIKLCCLAAAATLSGCASIESVPNLRQVSPGIWRGGQPTEQGWRDLQALGVRHVIKLNTGAEDATASDLGMRVEWFPITAAAQTVGKPAPGSVLAAASRIRPGTFIHCTHGRDRTGLVVGAYRVCGEGWSKGQAYQEMRALGFRPALRGLYWSWQEDVPFIEPEKRER